MLTNQKTLLLLVQKLLKSKKSKYSKDDLNTLKEIERILSKPKTLKEFAKLLPEIIKIIIGVGELIE